MAHRSLFGITREVVEEMVTCPICFEKYDGCTRAAKFLPCLHGFCVLCLGGLHVRDEPVFKCPVCRRDTEVPRDGVHDFPDNFIATKMKDLEHVTDVDLSQPHGLSCGSCKDGGVAVSFCSDAECLAFLCESCRVQHGRLRIYDGHVVSSMKQLQSQQDLPLPRHKLMCGQHRHERLSLFCDEEQCQRAMCLVCSATVHPHHRVIELDQKSAEVKKELQSFAEAARKKAIPVTEISGRINSEINRTSALFEERSTEISRVFDGLRTQLNKRQDAAIDDLRKLCFDKTGHLKWQTDRAESLASQLTSASQFAERACEIGNPVDLLNTRGQVISRIHELIALDVDTHLPFQPANAAFLAFTEHHNRVMMDLEILLPCLGTLDKTTGDARFVPRFKVDFPGQIGSSLPVKATQKVFIRAADDQNCPSFESLGGLLHAFLQAPDGSTTECKDGKLCGDNFEFEFQPLGVGSHRLSISVSGLPIAGSPFDFDVNDGQSSRADANGKPQASADAQAISSDVTWTDAFARCEHTIVVKLRGLSNPESLKAQYSMPDSPISFQAPEAAAKAETKDDSQLPTKPAEAEAQITETAEKGTFLIVYTPPAAGKLLMTVLADSKPLTSSPFTITVNPLHPNSTRVSTQTIGKFPKVTAVLDMPFSVTLVTQDHLHKRLTVGGYSVTASITTSSSPGMTNPYDVTDNQDGSYEIIFTPHCTETHMVDMKICGHPIKSGLSLVVFVEDGLPFRDPPDGYGSPSSMAVDKDRNIVYVADAKKACIHRLATDGCSMSAEAIKVTTRKSLLIAVNSAGKLVMLAPNSRYVMIYDAEGEQECRWKCTSENVKPANLALSRKDFVVIGDSELQTLFIYRPEGGIFGRISLPEGSLAAGMSNVCTDRNDNIIVATHSAEPSRILRYTIDGDAISPSPSPAGESNQLALVSTPEGGLVVAALGGILVLDVRDGISVVRKFETSHIYTGLAVAGDGCFVAFDRGEKHLAKHCYNMPQRSTQGGDNG